MIRKAKTIKPTTQTIHTLFDGCEYRLIRSDRKSLSLEITRDGEIVVRAPRSMRQAVITDFLMSRTDWIRRHRAMVQIESQNREEVKKLSQEELEACIRKAREIIPQRVAYYAPKVGVSYGRITIKHQRTRWGSCSSKGNLNFNALLMLTPLEVIDSVVVHELCHRKEMNHSSRFYREVYRVYPEYDKWHGWLKSHGREIMDRNP